MELNAATLERIASACKADTDAKLRLVKWLGVNWGERWEQSRVLATYIARRPKSNWEDRMKRAVKADNAAVAEALDDEPQLRYFVEQTTNCLKVFNEVLSEIQAR